MTIHHFSTTGAAYNATQCDESIKTGDVLVIESEQVVGLAWTWPLAITTEHGELHTVNPGKAAAIALDAGFTAEQIAAAVDVANQLGFTLSVDWSPTVPLLSVEQPNQDLAEPTAVTYCCHSVVGGWQTQVKETGLHFGPVFNSTTDLWNWQRDNLPRSVDAWEPEVATNFVHVAQESAPFDCGWYEIHVYDQTGEVSNWIEGGKRFDVQRAAEAFARKEAARLGCEWGCNYTPTGWTHV